MTNTPNYSLASAVLVDAISARFVETRIRRQGIIVGGHDRKGQGMEEFLWPTRGTAQGPGPLVAEATSHHLGATDRENANANDRTGIR
jgi:hypothetical protein